MNLKRLVPWEELQTRLSLSTRLSVVDTVDGDV